MHPYVRKSVRILALLPLLCALCACGGGESQSSSTTASQASTGQTVQEVQAPAPAQGGESAFVFLTGSGEQVALNENMEEVLSRLGDAQTYFESASCAFEGLDKQYGYSGFEITTRPEDTGDYVNSILLTDDSAATPEGVYIGCTPEQVTAAYGAGEETPGGVRYTRGDTTLSFILEDGKVVSIEYLPAE